MYLVKTNFSQSIFKFIFNPMMHGIYGFFMFIIIDIVIKVFMLLIDSRGVFAFEELDVFLGLLGFLAFFLIKIARNLDYKRKFS